MTYVIQIFLPLKATPAPPGAASRLRQQLTEKFGGVTAFTRSPARGAWRNPENTVEMDDIVVIETMADSIDHAFWRQLRADLMRELDERDILIRAHEVQKIE